MPAEKQDSIDQYAFDIIENLINEELQNQQTKTTHSVGFIDQIQQNEIEGKLKSTFFVENEDNYEIKDIVWPTIGEFNEIVGSQKIDDFIKNTWEYDECWLYCIDFIDKVDQEFKCLYNYKARWSIPTRRKPIPRFTACVYFTFEVSKIKPKDKRCNLYYVIEAQKFVHKPGKSRFRQEWLSDVIALKENMIKNCKF